MAKVKINQQNIVFAVFYAVIGLLLCILRMGLLNILLTIVGILILAVGIYDLVMYFAHHTRTLPRGLIEALIGIVIIVCGWTITTWVLIIIGILLVVKAVIDLVRYVKAHRHDKSALIRTILLIVVGLVLCIAPFALGDIICILVGLVFIVYGVLVLFGKKPA